MANGLRYESSKDMPPGMQAIMADKMLEVEAAVMLQALKLVDNECEYCKHATLERPCADDPQWVFCDNCSYCCPCNGCIDNSKYEWCGSIEARMRMSNIAKEKR